MADFKFEAIAVLVVLLPGFLAARIEQRLVVHREQGDLAKIVEALLYSFVTYLVFTLFTRSFPVALMVQTKGEAIRYSVETNAFDLVLLAVIATALAVVVSFATNNDLFGRLFRWMHVSRRSWRDSIWNDVFDNFGEAVQVEMSDGRSVMGWVKYYSDRSDEACLFLEHAAWVGPNLQSSAPGVLHAGTILLDPVSSAGKPMAAANPAVLHWSPHWGSHEDHVVIRRFSAG